MRTPLLDRRSFLRSAGAGFLATLSPFSRARAESTDAVFATAFQQRDGRYGAAILTESGTLIHRVDLPDRGHDITFDPGSQRCVVFARQPGTFAIVFEPGGSAPPLTIASAPGRHFYGHGVFSPDGKLLYATENDFENAAGMVGVYDARGGFARIGEFATHGIGPHEMLLMNDGRTLAVANGGIETHPDFGRAKLNVPTMKPSLVFLDRVTGDLIETQVLPASLHQLSIRHMDLAADGSLWFGCQHEGPVSERPALVGQARPGQDLRLVAMPDDILSEFRNYVGSVAANRTAGTVAFSSPQGNVFAILDSSSGAVLSAKPLVEVCGVAPDHGGFIATTGTGMIVDAAGVAMPEPDYVWDNHILRIVG
jgi:hypothetical protein